MRIAKLLTLSTVVLLGGVAFAGCGSSTAADRSTSFVTVTAETSGGGAGSTDSTTSAAASAAPSTGSAATPTSEPAASTGAEPSPSATESMAPVVTVDPLKADCTKVLNPTELGRSFGPLPAGTNRLLEAANPEREITGRLKCQYGVEGSSIAVQVVLSQFTSEAAADAQRELTASSERQAGAQDSTTTVMGHPADVLLRDGGLLVVGYDTWTLSVVVADGILDDAKLPAALAAIAGYALNQVVVNG